MALSDGDVQKQIKHMMAFIEQEANEKAEEIDAKAEEEFNLEKGTLVQNQRLKIMEYYERKEKQVELQKKIQSSNMLNQARLKALKKREDHVRSVMDEARRRLIKSATNQTLYRDIMEKLILQALFQLLETDVTVRSREADQELVNSLFPSILVKYKETSGKNLTLRLDTENFLPAETCGGIELTTLGGRLKISNTLESRLDLIAQQLVPQIRTALFGKNPNRKFAD
ncbi:hypothetical protein O3M35_003137 [Rhynocoris fuscipes]|uniref:V-type proton ATPase subunit E n=1 Tax=Rhynocoris fuscipes TaxID=488301 RepID=A0AAW1CJ27_9HEMI